VLEDPLARRSGAYGRSRESAPARTLALPSARSGTISACVELRGREELLQRGKEASMTRPPPERAICRTSGKYDSFGFFSRTASAE